MKTFAVNQHCLWCHDGVALTQFQRRWKPKIFRGRFDVFNLYFSPKPNTMGNKCLRASAELLLMLISQCKHLKMLKQDVMVIILAITTLALRISTWTGVSCALSHNLIHTNCHLYNKSVCFFSTTSDSHHDESLG